MSTIIASFNPCFNGTYSLTLQIAIIYQLAIRFNPCFNGTYSLTVNYIITTL